LSPVLQASYTIGCEARGIEVVKDRNSIAEIMHGELESLREHDLNLNGRCTDGVGQVSLRHGRLEVAENKQFLTGSDTRKRMKVVVVSPVVLVKRSSLYF
jgi:hypothetical protein